MDKKTLKEEIWFKAVRSSGAGGQHVNKVASKVELHFDFSSTQAFSQTEKELLLGKLKSRLTQKDELVLQCEESRSQHKNKDIVTQKFFDLIKENLKRPKPRKRTKPPKAAKLKRLRKKKIRSELKNNRKDPLKE